MRRLNRWILSSLLAIGSVAFPISEASAAGACSPTVTRTANFKYLTFSNTSVCTWTVPSGVTQASTILLVGGGGGSGYYGNAGGGGAGALVVTTNFSLTPGATFDITVGSGGLKPAAGAGAGTAGGATVFGSVSAAGGGYGAGGDGTSLGVAAVRQGGNGGSSGGGSSYNGYLTNPAGTSTASVGISSPWTAYGNSGAAGASNGGGGGGGAGAAANAGSGGAGKTYFGTVYAKGGSASSASSQNTAGTGNGGNVIANGDDGARGTVVIEIPRPTISYANTSPSTLTGSTFSNNVITSTGFAISSYSISPTLPADLSINSSGQIVGTPSALLATTNYTVTATDITGETGTASISLTITAGVANLIFNSINSTNKGTTYNLIVTAPGPGKVRFFANAKRIPNCLAVVTSQVSPYTATCSWKPSVQANTRLTATFTSTNGAFTSGSATPTTVLIAKRGGNR